MTALYSPFAVARRAGDFIFTGGIVDRTPPSTRPFYVQTAAAQAAAIYAEFERVLHAEGSGSAHLVSLLQFFSSRDDVAAYTEQRRLALKGLRPASTGIAVSGQIVDEHARVQVEGLAVASPYGGELRYVSTGESPHHPGAGYSQAVRFRDWVFGAGLMAADYRSGASYPGALGTGLAEAARADPNYWNASSFKTELAYIIDSKLQPILEAADSSLERLAITQVFLRDATQDFPAFCDAWLAIWSGKPPLTTIYPCTGLGTWGSRIEITPVALVGTSDVKVVDFTGEACYAPFPLVARRIGDYVFTTTLAAGDEHGVVDMPTPDGTSRALWDTAYLEMRRILDDLASIAARAGGSLEDVVRVRLVATDRRAVPPAMHAWREVMPRGVVVSMVEVVSGAWVPGCTVYLDATLYAPLSAAVADRAG